MRAFSPMPFAINFAVTVTSLLIVCDVPAFSQCGPSVMSVGADCSSTSCQGKPTPGHDPIENERGCTAHFPPLEEGQCAFSLSSKRNMVNAPHPWLGLQDGDLFDLKARPGVDLDEAQKKICLPNYGKPSYCDLTLEPSGYFTVKDCPSMGHSFCGRVPNSTLKVPEDQACNLEAINGAQAPFLRNILSHTLGVPAHAQSVAITLALNEVYRNSLANAPRGHEAEFKESVMTRTAQQADNSGQACKRNCDTAFKLFGQGLINVANEDSGTPTKSNVPFKSLSQAIWMVQEMFRRVYLPMAILLLLPGTILTQSKGLVTTGFLGVSSGEDNASPFQGIMRSVIAVFLIPATQLIMSYSIDLGNSLAHSVQLELSKNGRPAKLEAWVRQQAFSTDPAKMDNFISPVNNSDTSNPDRGKFFNANAETVHQERQNYLTTTLQNTYNGLNAFAAQGLLILNEFQTVVTCYLYLLGPVAASLYAWPAGIGRDLFKRVFSSWLDAVVVLCLWKFWWCIVLLCAALRLEASPVSNADQFEIYYFTAFMAILTFVPFCPFEFKPGDLVTRVLEHGNGMSRSSGNGKPVSQSGNSSAPPRGETKTDDNRPGGTSPRHTESTGLPGLRRTAAMNESACGSSADSSSSSASSSRSSMSPSQAAPLNGQIAPAVAPPPVGSSTPETSLLANCGPPPSNSKKA